MARPLTKWGARLHTSKRPTCDTALDQWMLETNWSTQAFAKTLGMDRKRLEYLRRGQNLPTLVWAFKIEKATGARVPASSWLATELGQKTWKEPS